MPLAAKMKSLLSVCCVLFLLSLSAAGKVEGDGVFGKYFRVVVPLDDFKRVI